MRRQGLGWLAASVTVLATMSCFKDPVTSLQGSATRLILSTTYATVTARPDTDVITIQAQDDQGNFQAFAAPTYTSVDPTIATMVAFPDTVVGTVPGATLWKALLIAGPNFGTTKIAVTAAGVTDTISVLTLPVAFAGTITPATVQPGDTVTIAPPAGLTFGATATATASSGSGFYKFVSRSATALKYLAGAAGASQTATISGATLGTTALPPLTTSATFSVTETNEPANDAIGTAPALSLPVNVGDSVVVYGSVSSSDIDDIFTISATTGDSVTISVDWPSSTVDIDNLLLNSTGTACVPASCPAATGADPEKETVRLTAATTYKLDINMFDNHAIPMPIGYRIVIIKKA